MNTLAIVGTLIVLAFLYVAVKTNNDDSPVGCFSLVAAFLIAAAVLKAWGIRV